jgi:hypothetical protein
MNWMLGQTGPAGGIVIYDKGNYSDGWRFLEVHPFDFQGEWGCQGPFLGITSESLGSGKLNTELVAPICGGVHSNTLSINTNGFSDWFVPSKNELELIFGNRNLISGLSYNGGSAYYWSSSEYNSSGAWTIYMNNGSWSASTKNTNYSYRPLRRF